MIFGEDHMKTKKGIKYAGVLLIVAALMIASFATASADTMEQIKNNVSTEGILGQPLVAPKGDSLFLQLPHDPSETWSMGTTDVGAGYKLYENFWGVTDTIGDLHWWGLCLVYSGGWTAGNPANLVFEISFYSDPANDPTMPPSDLVTTFTNVVPPTIVNTGQLYSGFTLYYFDGWELPTPVDLEEGWVAIQSTSPGQGSDWLLWASAKTGDVFSYHEGGTNPYLFDQAMNITGVGNAAPLVPAAPTGPSEGQGGVDYTFEATTTDPEGEDIYFQFDWDDGVIGDWVGPYSSGGTGSDDHAWTTPGDYDVKVRAKDINDRVSDWSTASTITILESAILDVRPLSGGLLKAKGLIRNNGGVEAINVEYAITLDGGVIILGKETTGTIASIPPGGEVEISTGLIFGIGSTTITVNAEEDGGASDTREQTGFVLLFFINVNPGGG